jgi:Protein of unknown function (DUF1569)
MAVNTAKVEGRRRVDYASFDAVLADADWVSSGSVKVLGNWSAGQIFRHLATAYNGSIDGFAMTFPWYFKLMAKAFKQKLINGAMPAGFNLPRKGAEELAPEPTSTEEGLELLRSAVARLQNEPHRAAHPMFGEITREEWDKIHLHHASLHMSFIVPK